MDFSFCYSSETALPALNAWIQPMLGTVEIRGCSLYDTGLPACGATEQSPVRGWSVLCQSITITCVSGKSFCSALSRCCIQLFWDDMDCSPPGSSVHGIFQARVLEQIAISASRASSPPTSIASPALAAGFFTTVPLGKLQKKVYSQEHR